MLTIITALALLYPVAPAPAPEYDCLYETTITSADDYTVTLTPSTSNGPVAPGKTVCCDEVTQIEVKIEGIPFLADYEVIESGQTVPLHTGTNTSGLLFPEVTFRLSPGDLGGMECEDLFIMDIYMTPQGSSTSKWVANIFITCVGDCE